MEKLLHEKLKELSERFAPPEEYTHGLAISETCQEFGLKAQAFWAQEFSSILQYIADEIERYYIPRPRFEDGKPVKRGDETAWGIVDGICVYSDGAWTLDDSSGTDIWGGTVDGFAKRPTPKVYDEDGVECREGDEVYDLKGMYDVPLTVLEPNDGGSVKVTIPDGKGYTSFTPDQLTHERPVFDAEGVMICKGDTVWTVHTANKFTVHGFTDDGAVIVRFCEDADDLTTYAPHGLIHHELDSLERIKADRELTICEYNAKYPDAVNIGMDDHLLDRVIALIERGA